MKINMLSENFLKFEKVFYQFYNTIPLFSLVDDIGSSMAKSGKNYFKLPAKYSKDGKNHYFYFKKGFCKVDREEVLSLIIGNNQRLDKPRYSVGLLLWLRP